MPSQISPPIQYQDGDAINGDAFNQHVSHATLLSGSISEQTDISVSAVPNVNKFDSIVIYDESEATTNKLRKATVEQLFNNGSSLPTSELITPKITAPALNDIIVTPKVGVLRIGKNYVSNDGFVVTVQDVNHGYDTGTLVKFTASSQGTYNGTFQVTKLTNDSYRFHNRLTVATTIGGGTINSEKAPTVAVIGNVTINDDLLVAGNVAISGTAKISGAVEVSSLKIGGKTPATVEDNFIAINVKTTHMTNYAFNVIDYQTHPFTVPPGESWTFQWTAVTHQTGNGPGNTRADLPYQWGVKINSLAGSLVDWVQAGSQPHGGTCITSRTIEIRNENLTPAVSPAVHTYSVSSPSVSTTASGSIRLVWTAVPVNGRNKWNEPLSAITVVLYRQRISAIPAIPAIL